MIRKSWLILLGLCILCTATTASRAARKKNKTLTVQGTTATIQQPSASTPTLMPSTEEELYMTIHKPREEQAAHKALAAATTWQEFLTAVNFWARIEDIVAAAKPFADGRQLTMSHLRAIAFRAAGRDLGGASWVAPTPLGVKSLDDAQRKRYDATLQALTTAYDDNISKDENVRPTDTPARSVPIAEPEA